MSETPPTIDGRVGSPTASTSHSRVDHRRLPAEHQLDEHQLAKDDLQAPAVADLAAHRELRAEAVQVYINGVASEVHGARPYSKVKILAAVMLAALVILIVVIAVSSSGDG